MVSKDKKVTHLASRSLFVRRRGRKPLKPDAGKDALERVRVGQASPGDYPRDAGDVV